MGRYINPTNMTKEEFLNTALRSGDYDQTQNVLRDSKGYCCLGVLCIVEGISFIEDDRGGGIFITNDRYAEDEFPPEHILGRTQLRKEDAVQLSTLNDEEDYTFDQIADYIEEKL